MSVQKSLDKTSAGFEIGRSLFLPGVSDKFAFLHKCQGCGQCLSACIAECIEFHELEPGARVPLINPHKEACIMCDDLPCSQACPNEALDTLPWKYIKMGVALLDPNKCLCLDHQKCKICVDLSPVNCIAIHWDTDISAPLINMDACTGCGVCASICPSPERAISILPL